jgi:hypothetical protein
MFRMVELPEGLAGRLFLHSMPGGYEAYEDVRQEIARCHISRVVCLAPRAEVTTTSRLYVQAIEADRLLAVEAVGSSSETSAQQEVISWAAAQGSMGGAQIH